MQRRHLLHTVWALPLAALLPPAGAAERRVEDLGLTLTLPDHWVPIPRAEILEAVARAREAGGTADWTLRAGWQRLPHLRWFSLPHLVLETQPDPGPDDAPGRRTAETEVARAGARPVHSHRAQWRKAGQRHRLTLLAWSDETALFDSVLDSLRETG